jgi:predicted metal-dependent HD superfamily phosphohydrolase
MQEILDKWKIKINYNILLSMWNESHRHWHNQSHLVDLLSQINESKIQLNSQKDYEKLVLTALFHDIIYDPSKTNNEELSAEFFINSCQEKNQDVLDIKQMILDTKNHESSTTLSKIFNSFDMNIVERDYDSLLEWEEGIWGEYKTLGRDDEYKKGRLSFLEGLLDKYPSNSGNLLNLIGYVKSTY